MWDRDHALRPLFEIFSVHGQSELFEPEHPLSYDQLVGMAPYGTYPIGSELVPEEHRGMVPISSSAPGPHYARDAWAAGLKLGTIAASDDHTARPGQPYWGLAAVWAERLDRATIFQALAKRQTYATTGQRIYLDFRINGGMPGTRVTAGGPPRIKLEVHGTDDIAWVELVAFDRDTRRFFPREEMDSPRLPPAGILDRRRIFEPGVLLRPGPAARAGGAPGRDGLVQSHLDREWTLTRRGQPN